MNAAQRAMQLRDTLLSKGYPFLGAELVLEIGGTMVWPLVQAWDDALESLILIACVEQDRHLVDALTYARAVANQDVFGVITLCYALGQDAWISEFDSPADTPTAVSHILECVL